MDGDRSGECDREAAQVRPAKENAEPISIDGLGVAVIGIPSQDSYCTSGRTTA
jgi:hypothetical protein